jgi:hypothetical protein
MSSMSYPGSGVPKAGTPGAEDELATSSGVGVGGSFSRAATVVAGGGIDCEVLCGVSEVWRVEQSGVDNFPLRRNGRRCGACSRVCQIGEAMRQGCLPPGQLGAMLVTSVRGGLVKLSDGCWTASWAANGQVYAVVSGSGDIAKALSRAVVRTGDDEVRALCYVLDTPVVDCGHGDVVRVGPFSVLSSLGRVFKVALGSGTVVERARAAFDHAFAPRRT